LPTKDETEIKILRESDLTDKVAVIIGTRPSIVKFSPVIRELQKRKVDFVIIHTGQHYSYNMDRQFFEDLDLPKPDYKNEAVKKTRLHGAQTAVMIMGIEEALLEVKPKIVIVGGDANSNLAGALAARKLRIQVAHMEAGLRSDDWTMPEENNRVMIDHISEYLFAPTEDAKRNLIEDNVRGEIFVTGNTIVDAVYQNQEIARKKSRILEELQLGSSEYFLITAHREENVDQKERLSDILESVKRLGDEYKLPLIFPIHPRTKNRLKEFQLENNIHSIPEIQVIEPLGYLDFLQLLASARLVLTDSGGVQEESCILGVPCVTLRENTERPETVNVGANLIAGTDPQVVLKKADQMLDTQTEWQNPFGDGKASERIVDVLNKTLS